MLAVSVCLSVSLVSLSLSLSLSVRQSLSLAPSLPGKAALWEAGAWGTQHSPDLCHCLGIILSSAPEHPDLDYKLCSHGPIGAEESHSLSTCFYLLGELCSLLGPCPRIRRPESKAKSCINSPLGGGPPALGRADLLAGEGGRRAVVAPKQHVI